MSAIGPSVGDVAGPDDELAWEQAHLDASHAALVKMRERSTRLLAELRRTGEVDLDYEQAMLRRITLLGESRRPLIFGRIDQDFGESWHLGRRHVETEDGHALVVDWRAPIAAAFYRARVTEPMGLRRRRQVSVDGARVVAIADDHFGDDAPGEGEPLLRGGDALLAELERARAGEMFDIVATIQAEQDEVIRSPLEGVVVVQGGPGTGKTAVGLHRAAFLLYNHPSLARPGVLVVGPSRAFLRYIAQVLPSLGEEAVVQTTVSDLASRLRVRAEDTLDARRVKGDPRMATVLHRALAQRRRPVGQDVVIQVRSARQVLRADAVDALVGSIARRGGPYKAGRSAVRARLVGLARQTMRAAGRLEAEEPWFTTELGRSEVFVALLDRLWPSVSPSALVSDLLSSPTRLSRAAEGVLHAPEQLAITRPRAASIGRERWTVDDLTLIDEVEYLINGRPRAFGHVVVDEAQDMSPMQLRALARRAPNGSMTVLGDLAQSTGAWSYHSWEEITAHLPASSTLRAEELTLGYRAPGQVLDFAARLLATAAPGIVPTRSVRLGAQPPRLLMVDESDLFERAALEAAALAGEGYRVGVVVAARDLAAARTEVAATGVESGTLERDGIEKSVTVLAATEAKGLEFDAVVVVEPAAIVDDDVRGLRLLYVALTRPTQRLSVVHARPLPNALAEPTYDRI